VVSVEVFNDAEITETADFAEACVDGVILLTSDVIGGSGAFTYQWQQSPTGGVGTWTDISGATDQDYSPVTSTPGTTYYRIIITDANTFCDDPVGPTTTVTIHAPAEVSASVNNPEICIGGSALLTASVTGGSGALTR
jgi:hypothetical protein